MKSRIGGEYVAGMWEKCLASQLLWRVPPAFEKGLITYPSRRPTYEPGDIRAPSFSWASVYATGGVKCGETRREQKLRISVKLLRGVPKREDGRFGLINDGCSIDISGTMRKVEIGREIRVKNTYYVWKLVEGGDRKAIRCDLDCPDDDFGFISGPDKGVYCVPVYNDPTQGLQCLLLKEEGDADCGHYVRIGYTLVPAKEVQHEATLEFLWPRFDTLPRKRIRII